MRSLRTIAMGESTDGHWDGSTWTLVVNLCSCWKKKAAGRVFNVLGGHWLGSTTPPRMLLVTPSTKKLPSLLSSTLRKFLKQGSGYSACWGGKVDSEISAGGWGRPSRDSKLNICTQEHGGLFTMVQGTDVKGWPLEMKIRRCEKATMVFGQMNEVPGRRCVLLLTDLTVNNSVM